MNPCFPSLRKSFLSASAARLVVSGLIATAGIFLSGCDKFNKPKLETDQQRASYALGQIIGQDMKNKGVDLDMKVFSQSMTDAIGGKENLMKPEDMQKALNTLRESAQKKMAATQAETDKKDQVEAEKNMAEAKAFLEKNKTADGVKVTASGLQYKVDTQGKGPAPKPTSIVSVLYRGTLLSGEEFDKNMEKPIEFPLNQVIPAWTEGLQLIKEGGKITLFVPPELGYGPRRAGKIPPNALLVFDVELKSVKK